MWIQVGEGSDPKTFHFCVTVIFMAHRTPACIDAHRSPGSWGGFLMLQLPAELPSGWASQGAQYSFRNFFLNWENAEYLLCEGQKVLKMIKRENYTLLWNFLINAMTVIAYNKGVEGIWLSTLYSCIYRASSPCRRAVLQRLWLQTKPLFCCLSFGAPGWVSEAVRASQFLSWCCQCFLICKTRQ